MDKEVKAEWVAALRSGDYEQGHNRLRTGDAYCCLGVLCDLYAKRGEGRWSDSVFLYAEGAGGSGCGVLPDQLVKNLGLPDDNPVVKGGNSEEIGLSLAELNDGFGAVKSRTFSQLADIIEREF